MEFNSQPDVQKAPQILKDFMTFLWAAFVAIKFGIGVQIQTLKEAFRAFFRHFDQTKPTSDIKHILYKRYTAKSRSKPRYFFCKIVEMEKAGFSDTCSGLTRRSVSDAASQNYDVISFRMFLVLQSASKPISHFFFLPFLLNRQFLCPYVISLR